MAFYPDTKGLLKKVKNHLDRRGILVTFAKERARISSEIDNTYYYYVYEKFYNKDGISLFISSHIGSLSWM